MATTPGLKRSRFPTLAEAFARLGDVPANRVLSYPAPGTAWGHDLVDPGITVFRMVEHVDGILVEKTWDDCKFQIAIRIVSRMYTAVGADNTGAVFGPKCRVMLRPDLIRIPDVTFVRWDSVDDAREIDNPTEEWLSVTPNIVVEVLRPGNTFEEMAIKLDEYEKAGIALVWYIDPEAKAVTVYPKGKTKRMKVLTEADTLDGGAVLPGLSIPVGDIFANPAPPPMPKKPGKKRK